VGDQKAAGRHTPKVKLWKWNGRKKKLHERAVFPGRGHCR